MGDNGAWLDYLEHDFKKDAAEGTAKIADSWTEMAEWIGAHPEDLKATVERYNSFCDKGYDNAAGFLKMAYKYPGQAMTFSIYSGYVSGEKAVKYISH